MKKRFWINIAIIWMMIYTSCTAKTMDISVHQAEVGSVVKGIVESENLEMIGGDALKGKVTIKLQDIEPLEAIRKLGETAHFSFVKEGNTLFFTADDKGKEGYDSHIFAPTHVKGEILASMLEAIIPSQRIKVRKDTEQVLVYGTKKEILEAKKILQTLDIAPRQVMVSAQVIAAQQSAVRELGITWDWLSLTGHGKDDTHGYASIQFGRAYNQEPHRFFYQAKLHALEASGKAVIIAKPNMMAVNGEEAHILIGDRVPIVTESKSNGETTSTVTYTESGIRLAYTPHIERDGYIDAVVSAEVSTPTLVSELKAYRITTREAKTRVRLKAGEILVIGGLMDQRYGMTKQKVPLLGDLPLLGPFFRSSRKEKEQVELIIILQAHLCDRESVL